MITLEEYFGPWIDHPDATLERKENAEKLIAAVNALQSAAILDGVDFKKNPNTDSEVSGKTYGGFRPQDCPQGSPTSSHKQGLGVDLFDPQGKIDEWCMANLDKLELAGIYIEAPAYTSGWSHWTIRPPGSGKRVFKP